jgi:hypothetical protein
MVKGQGRAVNTGRAARPWPFPTGDVVFTLTMDHGVHVGDLPALALLLVAAGLAI